MLSDGEVRFIRSGVLDDVRIDGRSRLDFRPLSVETGLLPQANGSARVVLDGTDVLVGVKAELGTPLIERADEGRVEVSVECCPSASPEFEGRGGSNLNLELSRVLERALTAPGVLDLKSLNLIEGKQCWVIFIDALVLDSTGNLLDALALASRAALSNVKIPRVNVIGKGDDVELEIDHEASITFDVASIPISVTFTMIGPLYVADASLQEEACSDCKITFFVLPNGNIATIHSGSGSVRREVLHNMTVDAGSMGKLMVETMDKTLEAERKALLKPTGFI